MPLTPFFRCDQKVSTSFPSGVTAPSPVMTTLRSFIKRVTRKRARQLTCHSSLVTHHFGSARSHADALNGLEEFSFRPDRWCDNDLGLLKFGEIARAHIAHARGDRPDEILTAVIYFGRPEKNLFERTSHAYFDPRAARKIDMRCGHSPMVASPGRFLRLGKGAPHHHCVRAAGERFANIATVTHPAVRDNRHEARCFFEVSIAGRGAIDRRCHLRDAQSEHAA